MLRYTPGGLPIVRFCIEHQSIQVEAGSGREVACRVNAVAIGDIATRVPAAGSDEQVAVRGFLCRAGLKDERLVLHVEALKMAPPETTTSDDDVKPTHSE
ncbi:MAG: primosomal replication protein N [Betaproteobacteria bacterium]|jgi:primosomal replication protein N|nr:primosomal replication protein N [Betaproteobacteria bacterium]